MTFARWLIAGGLVCAAMACIPTKLTPDGAHVWLTTQAPYPTCRFISHVEGRPALSYNDSKTVVRNNAARQGANFVHVDEVVDGVVRATSYDCPAMESAEVAVPESPGPRAPVLETKAAAEPEKAKETPKKEKAARRKKTTPASATPTRSAE